MDKISGAAEDENFVYFSDLQPGTHSIATTYTGSIPVPSSSKEMYSSRLVETDRTTGGNWGGVYGNDGYVLCGYRADGADQQVLPPYVTSLDFFRAFPKAGRPDTTAWASGTSDHRALAPNRENGTPRTASCLSNVDQTMTVAIKIQGDKKFRVALYFVDWDNKGERAAVEMFDADTLKLIAPVSLVSEHSGGQYLVYECDRSVKFRFDKVRGDIVTLSGIFFDPMPAPRGNDTVPGIR